MGTSGGRPILASQLPSSSNTVANPAAGADFSFTLTGGAILESVTATLTTAVAVANRSPALKIVNNVATVVVRGIQTPAVQAASLTVDYTWMVGAGAAIVGANQVVLPLPSLFVTAGTWTFSSLTNLIQAADQWSNIAVGFVQT